jgi:DMSO/TMAO reductase YedYZ molybdopterin-dependent catalytic subunit
VNEPDLEHFPQLKARFDRRRFLRDVAVGTAFVAFGSLVRIRSASAETRPEMRADGRVRLPPGQRAIEFLKPMGGDESDGKFETFRLKVHGLVAKPFEVDYAALLKLPQVEKQADVHCVTGWSMLGGTWKGVQIATLAKLAELKPEARYVIFEAANGYTANVPLKDAMIDTAMVTYRLNGKPLAIDHGAPVRGLVPDLYFWKSAKWITGIKFVKLDEPGYWETRGYNNHADPWREQRYG